MKNKIKDFLEDIAYNSPLIITVVMIIGVAAVIFFVGIYPSVFGNKKLFDTKQIFNKAIIQLQNGEVVECEIDTWKDYEGEQLQIVAEDGTVYLTSSFNCTLIWEH